MVGQILDIKMYYISNLLQYTLIQQNSFDYKGKQNKPDY